jgi:hypothetical protein
LATLLAVGQQRQSGVVLVGDRESNRVVLGLFQVCGGQLPPGPFACVDKVVVA